MVEFEITGNGMNGYGQDEQLGARKPQPRTEVLYRYDGYIAYSRLDREFSRTFQEDLERRFHSIAPRLRGSRRRIVLCRDETDFTASEDLPTSIRTKLRESRKLIVVCSPSAKHQSYWVPKEIAFFRELARARPDSARVIAVLVAGNDPVRETAFPEGLLNDGSEPLAVEFRPEKIASEIRYEDYRRGDGVLRVLAPLLDLEYPEVKDRQSAYERQRWRNRILLLTALLLAFACLALYAIFQRNDAVDRLADNYWAQATAAASDGDWLKAAHLFARTAQTARREDLKDDAMFPVNQLGRVNTNEGHRR